MEVNVKGTRKQHWEIIYKSKSPAEVSWFQPHLEKSLELIAETGIDKKARIIDVGGGASTLADDLLKKGHSGLTVLDISSEALRRSKERLGDRANQITWIGADILKANLPKNTFDLWHDRAVFHFLPNPADRKKYLDLLNQTLKSKSHLIIATFGLKGPERCSGLDVIRYSPETLQAGFGENYRLIKTLEESHQSPFGTNQHFIYCLFQRRGVS